MPIQEPLTVEETPEMVKRATESVPENPESLLLSAKLTRNAAGITLMLRSPVLEQFFKVLSGGVTHTVGVSKRWRITNPAVLHANDGNSPLWVFPSSASTIWLIDGVYLNLQLFTTCGLGSGVNLTNDIPMTKDAMKSFLENLKLAAKEIYISFCTPVEGEINLSITERLSTGAQEINDN